MYLLCNDKDMIFYFTATGNSLYVAKNIEKDLKSIPKELQKGELNYKSKQIGIVAPIYAGKLPNIVQMFIENAKFDTSYFYMILTYGHNDTIASLWSYEFCKKNHINIDYIRPILMIDNYLPSFDMNDEMSIDKKVEDQLEIIKNDIEHKICYISKPQQDGLKLYQKSSQRFRMHPELINGEAIIMNHMNCEGCGICMQVCPIGNIEMVNQKAQRLKNTCEFCLACVHHCPFHAIELTKEKNVHARYRHPKISLKEIVQSNHQNRERK